MQTLYEIEDHWVFCYDNKESNQDFVAHLEILALGTLRKENYCEFKSSLTIRFVKK